MTLGQDIDAATRARATWMAGLLCRLVRKQSSCSQPWLIAYAWPVQQDIALLLKEGCSDVSDHKSPVCFDQAIQRSVEGLCAIELVLLRQVVAFQMAPDTSQFNFRLQIGAP